MQLVPPEGVLTDPSPRSPMDPEEDLGLAAMMGDSEVPLVGGDQAAVRNPTSGPEDTPRCRSRSPPGNVVRISLGPRLLCHLLSRRNQPPFSQM